MTLKMDSINEIMRLCRLCLAKDEVNTPIFEEHGDIKQILLKISACLPVKVSKEDNLPKNICDGCSCKLEMLYHFWSTSANSEKKLIKLLDQIGVNKLSDNNELPMPSSLQSQQHSISSDPVVLKQEVVDVIDSQSVEEDLVHEDLIVTNDQDYLLEQEQIPYQPVEFQFQQDGFETVTAEDESTNVDTKPESESKPRKRRAAAMKALATMESEDEDDPDLIDTKIAKTEEQSDESAGEDPEPTTFVGLPSADDEQPGPSGVGKPSSDAPTVKTESLSKNCVPKRAQKEKRIWSCNKCNEVFVTLRLLRDHRKAHRKENDETQYNYNYDEDKDLFVCFTCDQECKTKEEIETHVLKHEEKFVCNICDETFVKPHEYSCHLFNHDQSKGFQCPFCDYSTNRRTAIMIHINTYHLRKYIYTCSQCGKGFNDCVMFKEHNNIHEGKKPFRCVVCEKDFAFSSYLNSHQLRNHKVTIDGMIGSNQCCICSKTFARKNALENHMVLHSLNQKRVHEKKHLCDICGKGFSRNEKLRIHYRVHTGVKPYSCSYCSKSFTKRDYMIMHERVHSGEKPYSCEYCGKCFNQGAPLRLHIRSHTGERPYRCHICNTGFISRGVLNLHFRNCPGSSN